MLSVPRHEFVPAELRDQAYADKPLPIGEAQTISQPFIVAAMTQALELSGDEHVLEIGTGSGYQAAVLSLLAREVITVESQNRLALSAQELLTDLGYTNVHVHHGDGSAGFPDAAPYDAIVVTAAAPEGDVDFVSRLFAPGVGIPEDPVTGSAHCALGPWWGPRLAKTKLVGQQLSRRGGIVRVGLAGDRVLLGGSAVTVWQGALRDA